MTRVFFDADNDWKPCETIVLDAWRAPAAAPLPPWPVIGIGPFDAPEADRVDIVAPSAALAARIEDSILKRPRTALVLVQLLRGLETVGPGAALALESLAFGALQAGADFESWLKTRPSATSTQAFVHAAESEPVRLERDGGHLDIVLNRPAARNVIDRSMRDGLDAAFALVSLDESLTSATVRGCGPCFSIGGDLAEFGTTRDPVLAHEIRCRSLPARRLIDCGPRMTFHVHGPCIGAGIEMAAFGGRIVAHRDAWFQLPEMAMGLIPGAGGCVSIPRRIGRQRTALMVLSGKRINAATALQWGLIDAIAPTM